MEIQRDHPEKRVVGTHDTCAGALEAHDGYSQEHAAGTPGNTLRAPSDNSLQVFK